MTIRTTRQTATFRRPFRLAGFDEEQPAGDYVVETDEELLGGLSFLAYRRTQTLIHLHAKPGSSILTQVVSIDPKELAAALKRDQAGAEPSLTRQAGDIGAKESADSRQASADRRAVERGEDDGMRVHSG